MVAAYSQDIADMRVEQDAGPEASMLPAEPRQVALPFKDCVDLAACADLAAVGSSAVDAIAKVSTTEFFVGRSKRAAINRAWRLSA